MPPGFTVTTSHLGLEFVAQFAGVLDEHAVLGPVHWQASETLVFDLGGVTGVNSLGIRTWVEFVTKSTFSAPRILLRRCATMMMEQFAMIPSTMPKGATIETFYAQFLCLSCNAEEQSLVGIEAVTAQGLVPPICGACGETMEHDDTGQLLCLVGRSTARSGL